MAATTFTWFHDYGSQMSCTPEVNVVKFGGYELRVPKGINSLTDKWKLTFDRTEAEVAPILAFVRARAAVEAFNWTNPDGIAGVYVCRDWTRGRDPGHSKYDLTFEQVFES